MKYSSYHILSLFLAGLFTRLWLRNAPARQKEIENHRFQKQATLSKLMHLSM